MEVCASSSPAEVSVEAPVITSERKQLPSMSEAKDIVMAGLVDKLVDEMYEKAEKNLLSGRYVVCYAATTTNFAPEEWQRSDSFEDASEMVPTLVVFLLSLKSVGVAKVWFEDRFHDDGTPRVAPDILVYGVCPGNAHPGGQIDCPQDLWNALPLTLQEISDKNKAKDPRIQPSRAGLKRAATVIEDDVPPVPALPASKPLTGLEAVATGGIDPESIPLDHLAAAAADTLSKNLFGDVNKPNAAPVASEAEIAP